MCNLYLPLSVHPSACAFICSLPPNPLTPCLIFIKQHEEFFSSPNYFKGYILPQLKVEVMLWSDDSSASQHEQFPVHFGTLLFSPVKWERKPVVQKRKLSGTENVPGRPGTVTLPLFFFFSITTSYISFIRIQSATVVFLEPCLCGGRK